MKPPVRYRKDIPFFYDKSENEFRDDPYERFDPMVVRQTGLHLADPIWGKYPWQLIHDFASPYLDIKEKDAVLELGCSTGRWIATIARQYPKGSCWGIDYSYQLLRRAKEFWIDGATIYLDFSKHGGDRMIELPGHQLSNLQFGLAKSEALPFDDSSQQVILNSFLLDRLSDPGQGLLEMYRVLAKGGRMIMVTPLNFLMTKHWEEYFPAVKIYKKLTDTGFTILEWEEQLLIEEPLDLRGNSIHWNCLALVVEKR